MPLNSSTFGKAGEDSVAAHLEKAGYTVIARNYASCGGEIDIVAYKKGIVAFVEVKTRSGSGFGSPADAVNEEKQRRIKNAAEGFIYEQAENGYIPVYSKLFRRQIKRKIKACRFDVAEVFAEKNFTNHRINIIENLF